MWGTFGERLLTISLPCSLWCPCVSCAALPTSPTLLSWTVLLGQQWPAWDHGEVVAVVVFVVCLFVVDVCCSQYDWKYRIFLFQCCIDSCSIGAGHREVGVSVQHCAARPQSNSLMLILYTHTHAHTPQWFTRLSSQLDATSNGGTHSSHRTGLLH